MIYWVSKQKETRKLEKKETKGKTKIYIWEGNFTHLPAREHQTQPAMGFCQRG
jgi:hypothetical protein